MGKSRQRSGQPARAIILAVVGLAAVAGPIWAHAQARPDNPTVAASPSDTTADGERLRWPSAWPSEVTKAGAKTVGPAADGDPSAAVLPVAGGALPGENAGAETAAGTEAVATPPVQPAVEESGTASPPSDGPGPQATSPQTRPADSASPTPQAQGASTPPQQPAPAANVPGPSTPPGQDSPVTQPPAAAPPAAAAEGAAPAQPATPNGVAQPNGTGATPAPGAPPPVAVKASVASGIEAAKALAARLDSVEKSIERVSERDEELTERLPKIESLISDSITVADRLKPELADVNSQIDKLGPAPENGSQEAAEIASARQRLQGMRLEIDGAIKTAELAQVRARQLISRIQELRLQNFRRSLFARSPSILSPTLWGEALAALPQAGSQLLTVGQNWLNRAVLQWPGVLAVLLVAFATWLGLSIAGRRLRRYLRSSSPPDVVLPFSQRALTASVYAPLALAPPVAAAGVIYAGFDSLNLFYLQVGQLAAAAVKAIVIIAAGRAFLMSYLAPRKPAWRPFPIGDTTARAIYRLALLAIIVFAIDVFLRTLIGEFFLPLPVNIAWTGIVSLAFALIFMAGMRVRPQLQENADPRFTFLAERAHRLPLGVATAIMVIGVITGYTALSHYVGTRSLVVTSAVFLLIIFYITNRALAAEPDELSQDSEASEANLPLGLRKQLALGVSMTLDVVLALVAIPILMLAFGFAPEEIRALVNRALFGFEFGGVEISLVNIGFAVGLFAAIVFGARLLQNWLGETVLHPSRIDQGLGNSIRTGIGYLGFFFAALVGLSYAGLDITNLAIVAGALSVGIGFGLQSIVNNFVSGLILLVERPIKVGDWIKVGEMQGHVRRISVRSTEIETFERASVIIPNSELISGTVTNLTLRNALGRITVPIGVSYDSDPDQVQELLLSCANECKTVARHPAPFVVFENFGASSLDFSLRFFVPDVNTSMSTQTEVRKRIVQKFRDAGIEIPFPQRVVNVRHDDGRHPSASLPLSGEPDLPSDPAPSVEDLALHKRSKPA